MQTRGEDSHVGADGRDVAARPAPPRMPATPEAGQARRDPPPEPSESSALTHLVSDFRPPNLGDSQTPLAALCRSACAASSQQPGKRMPFAENAYQPLYAEEAAP